MKYFINENCIGCGLCEGLCPEVFTLTDEGVAFAEDKDVDAENLAAAAEAMESCPVSAIEEA